MIGNESFENDFVPRIFCISASLIHIELDTSNDIVRH